MTVHTSCLAAARSTSSADGCLCGWAVSGPAVEVLLNQLLSPSRDAECAGRRAIIVLPVKVEGRRQHEFEIVLGDGGVEGVEVVRGDEGVG